MKNNNSNEVIADYGAFGTFLRLSTPEEKIRAISEFVDSEVADKTLIRLLIDRVQKMATSTETLPQQNILKRLQEQL